MEKGVNAVSTVRLDGVAVSALCELLNDRAVLLEGGSRLCNGNRSIQTITSSLNNADSFRVCDSLLTDVVGFVDVSVETAVVKSDVDVENITVFEDILIGNAVADGLVNAGAYRLGEVAVIEWGGV